MKRIYVQNGIVFFYGNPAGYLGDGKAVIDCMFQKEELVSFVKEQFLVELVFREGVYDRLSEFDPGHKVSELFKKIIPHKVIYHAPA